MLFQIRDTSSIMKAICLSNLPVHAIGIYTWSAVFLDGIQVVDNLIFKKN